LQITEKRVDVYGMKTAECVISWRGQWNAVDRQLSENGGVV